MAMATERQRQMHGQVCLLAIELEGDETRRGSLREIAMVVRRSVVHSALPRVISLVKSSRHAMSLTLSQKAVWNLFGGGARK
jgi:hypothetical protein